MAEPLTLYIVPHTHWDREWYLTFQQFRARLVSCVDHLIALMESDPAFTHFLLDGQMIVLDDYLEVRPEQAATLQRLAREGRIQIGPWYVQPDEFLPSGEAIVRNLLIGQRLAAPYGGAMQLGYVPDTFGHIAQLPQILRGFGMDAALFWRGVGHEVEHSEFWWDAPNGSRVLGVWLCGESGYSNARDLPRDPVALAQRLEFIAAPMLPRATTQALLLMNGSDHLEPQAGLPEALQHASSILAERGWHPQLATLQDYIAAIRAAGPELRRYSGEWRSSEYVNLLPDMLSTRMWIKQRTARIEDLLTREVDPLTAWTSAIGEEHPTTLIDLAWRYLLQTQPHDSICGTGIDQIHREMIPRFDQSEQIGEEIRRRQCEAIAHRVHTHDLAGVEAGAVLAGAVPIVVTNVAAFDRDAVVDVRVQLAAHAMALAVQDDRGDIVTHEATTEAGRELFRQALPADQLPGILTMLEDGHILGYRILGLVCEEPIDGVATTRVEVSDHGEPDLALTDAAVQQLLAHAARPDVQAMDFLITEGSWTTVRFAARDLPALGARAYLVRGRHADDPSPPLSQLAATATTLENPWLRVTVTPEDGTVTLADKSTGQIFAGLHRFQDGGDVGDEYTYAPPASDVLITRSKEPPVIALQHADALSATIVVRQTFDLPTRCASDRQTRVVETTPCRVETEITLGALDRRVAFHTIIENHAEDHRLRVLFPTSLISSSTEADATFMVMSRPIPEAVDPKIYAAWAEDPPRTAPQKRFVDVSDGQHGLALVNVGLPEYEAWHEADGTVTLALTLLRCVGWLSRDDFSTRRAHAGPMLATPDAQMPGTWRFDYALVPHAGTWRAEEGHVAREAEAFALPVQATPTDLHSGDLPAAWSWLRLAPATLRLSTIKRAEDGNGIIVRWYNPLDVPIVADLASHVSCDAVSIVSLDEQRATPLTSQGDAPQHQWRVPTPPGGIVTVRLVPSPNGAGMH